MLAELRCIQADLLSQQDTSPVTQRMLEALAILIPIKEAGNKTREVRRKTKLEKLRERPQSEHNDILIAHEEAELAKKTARQEARRIRREMLDATKREREEQQAELARRQPHYDSFFAKTLEAAPHHKILKETLFHLWCIYCYSEKVNDPGSKKQLFAASPYPRNAHYILGVKIHD